MVSELFTGSARRLADGRFELGEIADASAELRRGNPQLIWGWKRDVGEASRIVYFGGELTCQQDQVVLSRWYLFYRHRGPEPILREMAERLSASQELAGLPVRLKIAPAADGSADLRLDVGTPSATDTDRVRRLQLRRPRRRFADITLPPPLPIGEAGRFMPADIYVGSGLSYEAGLPTLCDMHLAFGVDNDSCTRFAVGSEDRLPERLATDLAGCIGSFCAVHVGALAAPPTPAMRTIADLLAAGRIRKVFTDNVDNLLAKVGVPFERTRGSGVFNEVYPATFTSDRLIVVGVAADRRSLVKQARAKGLEIVIVNPCEKVAPMVRHLDYARATDPFFRVTADAFFREFATPAARPAHVRKELDVVGD